MFYSHFPFFSFNKRGPSSLLIILPLSIYLTLTFLSLVCYFFLVSLFCPILFFSVLFPLHRLFLSSMVKSPYFPPKILSIFRTPQLYLFIWSLLFFFYISGHFILLSIFVSLFVLLRFCLQFYIAHSFLLYYFCFIILFLLALYESISFCILSIHWRLHSFTLSNTMCTFRLLYIIASLRLFHFTFH